MKLEVGDRFDLNYNIGQMFQLLQSLSGGSGFDLLKLFESDLEDPVARKKLSAELEKLFVNVLEIDIDESGIMHVDMSAYLRDVASEKESSRGVIRSIFGTDNISDLAIFNINGRQVKTNYSDQELAQYMLNEGKSTTSAPLKDLLNEVFDWYVENESEINSDIDKSLSYTYTAIDAFSDGGGKISNVIAKNSIIIDCKFLHKDLYDIIYTLAIMLQDKHIVLYSALRPRLNQILVYIRDRLSVCDYAPEINAILVDQPSYYTDLDGSLPTIPELANNLIENLKTNEDGSLNAKGVEISAPVYTSITDRSNINAIQSSINFILIIMLALLSTVVVYTLMLADVEE